MSAISSESENSPKNRSGSNLMKQLSSDLHSFWQPQVSESSRVSRYGRQQKQKETDGFVPSDLTRFISKSGSKVSPNSRVLKPRTPEKLPEPIQAPIFDEGIELVSTSSELSTCSSVDFLLPEEPVCVTSDIDSGRGSSIDFQLLSTTTNNKVGTVLWAKFRHRCWWPCLMSSQFPDSLRILSDFKVYVRFFADNGRGFFVDNPCKLVLYKGLEDFKLSGIEFDQKFKNFSAAVLEADEYLKIQASGHCHLKRRIGN